MAVNFVAKYVHAEMPVTGNPNADRVKNFQVHSQANLLTTIRPRGISPE
jgi:hypothetical protein